MLIGTITAALFGLVFGSFLNVCIARLPKGESIVAPRSHCRRCAKPIPWFDNIPVLSFVFLRGRCRNCRQPISFVYPLVELLTAALWVAALAEYQLSPEFLKAILIMMLLEVVIFTDLNERRIPHAVTRLGIALGLLMSLIVPVDDRPLAGILDYFGLYPGELFGSLLGAGMGALVGGGTFLAVGQAFYLASGRKKEYLGFGDVMLMFMVGTFLGVPLTLVTILLGSLVGTLIAVPLTLARPGLRNFEWPYGTFLGAAAIFSTLGGQTLLDWYLRFTGMN